MLERAISSKCAARGQGIFKLENVEGTSANQQRFLRVNKGVQGNMCEPSEGVCLVAGTLLTLSSTLLCLKNNSFPEPLKSLSLSWCSNYLVPLWGHDCSDLRRSEVLTVSFSLAGFCR